MTLANSKHYQTPPFKFLVAGGLVLATVLTLADFRNMRSLLGASKTVVNDDDCQEFVQTDATLSRQQLAELLTIPERDSKERVREILAEPYCRLSDLKLRAGVDAEREAYPLEFDPKTQLVILYEDNEYAGYKFKFK